MIDLLHRVLLVQAGFIWNPWQFLAAFGFALLADAFLIWVIFHFGTLSLQASNARVVTELRKALEEARRFPAQVADQYARVQQRLETHDNLLRAHAERITKIEARIEDAPAPDRVTGPGGVNP